ncbi:MAG: hypothetical protein A4E30_01069 [Methanomassiliicoccales archaeon PtaB.Bin215]|nr:MAG: hypothetical protein A4E30_01069 [Methanomassiliicoccales archaeon PtaB.Bin215]
MNMTSPTLVTKNAFLAARAAEGLSYQKPMSRYEQRPTSSQNTNIWKKLLARTSPSMTPTNRQISVKYRCRLGPWSCM